MVSGALETLTAASPAVAPTGEARDEGVAGDAADRLPTPADAEVWRAAAPSSLRGAQAWIRYHSGQSIPVGFDQLRWEHFTGSVPWRRMRSRRGQAHLPGEYFAATTGGHVIYESRLELSRLLLADFDGDVVGIHAQPFRLVAWVEGRQRSHVPDFLTATREGVVTVVNVKPARRLTDPAVAQALAWPAELVRRRGWVFEVWSGCDPVVLDNIRFLAAYRRPWIVAPQDVERACAAVDGEDQLAAVERRLAGDAPPYVVRPAVMAALWRGRLVADLTRPLSGASVLRRPS